MEKMYEIYTKLKARGYEVHERNGFWLLEKDGIKHNVNYEQLVKIANS